MKTKATIFVVCALLVGVFSFYSCDTPIALGSKLNLVPPVVTIDSPDFMQNISSSLVIKGTAKDAEEIVFLNVTVEKSIKAETDPVVFKKDFQSEKGRWLSRSVENAWETVTDNSVKWTVNNPGNIEWSITIDMTDADDGEYLITANAINNVKNEGAKQQQRVIIDKKPPEVKVFFPQMELGDYETAVTGNIGQFALQKPDVLDRLHNKSITIQYEIEDDFTFESLTFQLVGREDGQIYYNAEKVPLTKDSTPDPLSWSGKLVINGDELKQQGTGVPITNGPVYMKLIMWAKDKAGNDTADKYGTDPENYDELGWLVWWPEADNPWTEIVAGAIPSEAENAPVSPGRDFSIRTYDNDGVDYITYTIWKTDGTGAQITQVEKNTLQNTVWSNDSPKQVVSTTNYFPWSFVNPKDAGAYRIDIECFDINGENGFAKKSSSITRYFMVRDSSAPGLVVDFPLESAPAFGTGGYMGTNADFTLSGVADFGENGFSNQELKVVWLNPKNISESRVLYKGVDYEGWDLGSNTSRTDAMGNRVWKLDLIGTPPANPDDNRYYRNFSQTFNLFGATAAHGLGIGEDGATFTTQSFMFWVKGGNGRQMTQVHTLNGDILPPTGLSITQVALERVPASENITYFVDSNGKLHEGSLGGTQRDMIKTLAQNDKITLRGTWHDDSTDRWTGISDPMMQSIKVTWNDPDDKVTAKFINQSTWEAELTITGDEAMRGGGFVMVTITDLGGNASLYSYSIKVNTQAPQLLLASSETRDGSYKSGDTIDVYLEFNKPVKFSGGTGNPTLNMVVGTTGAGTATYVGPINPRNGVSDKHAFTYNVVGTTTAKAGSKLGTGAINMNNGEWRNDDDSAFAVPEIPSNTNLQNTKNILIDNNPPAIVRIESLSGEVTDGTAATNNYYNAGKVVYIRVDFDEEIRYTSGATLTLNSATVANPVISGTDALLFTYTIGANQNTPGGIPPSGTSLQVTGITLGTSVSDMAGNASGNTFTDNINSGTDKDGKSKAKIIYVDTSAPAQPTFTDGNGAIAAPPPVKVTLEDFEAGAEREYQTRFRASSTAAWGGWGSWLAYPADGITLRSAGDYQIRPRQIDLAGNESATTTTKTVTIQQTDPLLRSWSGSPTGTYGLDSDIIIELNLRKPVTLPGTMTLTLNTPTASTVSLSNVTTATSTLRFTYKVAAGDDIDLLKVTKIDLTGNLMEDGNNVAAELPRTPEEWGTKGLELYTKITIDTSTPQYLSAAINGTNLLLTFDKEVYKGTGNITLRAANYRAPAVLTRAEYLRWGGDGNLGNYYTKGTNGTNAAGVADTSEKYILNYNYDSTSTVVIGALTTSRNTAAGEARADEVIISVASASVVKGGTTAANTLAGVTTTNKQLVVDLSSTYALPVKGVNYTVEYLGGLIKDQQGNLVAASPAITVPNPGVNTPFIRIQKKGMEVDSLPVASGEMVTRYITSPNARSTAPNPLTGWTTVAAHWIENPNHTTTNPNNDLKWRYTDSSNTYWAPANATIAGAGDNTGDTTLWAQVPSYYMYCDTADYTFDNMTGNAQYVRVAIGQYQAYAFASVLETVTGQPNRPTSAGRWLAQGYQQWIRIDTTKPIGTAAVVTAAGGTPGQIMEDIVIYRKVGTGTWYERSYGNDGIDNNALVQISAYYVRIGTGTTPWPDTQPAGAGYVRTSITERTWYELGTGIYRTAQPTSGWSVNTGTAYYIETNVGDGWTGGGTANTANVQVRVAAAGTVTAVAIQPLTAQFKIDCQTPTGGTTGLTLRYAYRTTTTGAYGGTTNVDGQPANNYTFRYPVAGYPNPTVTIPADTTTAIPAAQGQRNAYTNPVDIGNADAANYDGLLYGIRAAVVNTGNTEQSVAYEKAARSIIRFRDITEANNWNNGNNKLLQQASGDGEVLQLWLRGGDRESGANLTPGFPLSWDETDLGGARLMTQDADGQWYWVTWEVTAREALFHFIAGTTITGANALTDVLSGPRQWTWAKNAWAFQHNEYPLFPGASLDFRRASTVSHPATDAFEFYDKFNNSR